MESSQDLDDQVKDAINKYRDFMNVCEIQSNQSLNTRQEVSRHLAALILKYVSRCSWTPFDSSLTTGQSNHPKSHRYFGSSLFVPGEREEEIMLLLMISEMFASRDVVLDRGSEFDETRNESLENVIAIYDLMTITLTPFKYFMLDMFEKAVKFSFEIKHIWFQFGLSMMETKKYPQRAVLIFKEVARIDSHDPLPLILASKIYILELNDYEKGLITAQQALKRENSEQLLPKIYLLIGIANAMIYEGETESIKKLKVNNLNESIKHFELLAKLTPDDHLPFYHLALHMAHQRAINDAILNAQVALVLNPYHLPSIQLLILCLSSLKKYQEALSLCDAALEEYPDQLLLLFIKVSR